MRKFFLTFFYSGLLPKAPGTWGTMAGLIVAWFVVQNFGYQTLFLATIFITIVSFKEIDKYEDSIGEHDSKEIVIDEVVGIWLSLCITGALTPIYFALNFIFFRIFDIWKPSIIGKIDRDVKGGYGVMGDDLLAGVFGAICSGAVYMLIEKFV
jgi:phosphatidylglycerophosphatase A